MVVAFYDVVLCFTMLNGQIPFVCFLFNSVFVRTIFSEAPLINNGCAAHVKARLIFYTAAALSVLSGSSQVLKTFVRQFGCGPGTPLHVPLLLAPTQVQKAPECLWEAREWGHCHSGHSLVPALLAPFTGVSARVEEDPSLDSGALYVRMRSQELLILLTG